MVTRNPPEIVVLWSHCGEYWYGELWRIPGPPLNLERRSSAPLFSLPLLSWKSLEFSTVFQMLYEILWGIKMYFKALHITLEILSSEGVASVTAVRTFPLGAPREHRITADLEDPEGSELS